jgi:predicted ester cyclase
VWRSDRWTADQKAIVLRGPRSTLRAPDWERSASPVAALQLEGSGFMATTTENIGVARRLLEETFGAGKLDLIDELCVEGYVDHDPILGDHGRESVKDSIAGYREAFPDLTFTVQDSLGADDKVVVRWTAQGTFENEFMGQQPTGEKGDPIYGISIDRFEDGKVAESWTQWDTLRFMRNIGAMPEPAEVASSVAV